MPEDRFQTITEHRAENVFSDADDLNLYRSETEFLTLVAVSQRCEPRQKAALYKPVGPVARESAGVARGRLLNLMIGDPPDFSMGNGQATYSVGCRWLSRLRLGRGLTESATRETAGKERDEAGRIGVNLRVSGHDPGRSSGSIPGSSTQKKLVKAQKPWSVSLVHQHLTSP